MIAFPAGLDRPSRQPFSIALRRAGAACLPSAAPATRPAHVGPSHRSATERAPALRPVQAGDADALQRFVMGLSPAARRMRFHAAINACTPALLKQLTQTGNPRHRAWLAWAGDGAEAAVVGEARFHASEGFGSAEMAMVVADGQQGRGLADRLLCTLLDAASRAGVQTLYGDVLNVNVRMAAFLQRHGFALDPHADVDPGIVRWQCDLRMPWRRLLPA